MKHWPVLMQLHAGDDDEKAYWDSVWRDAEAKKLSGNCLCGAGDWEVAKQWYTEAEQLLRRLPSAVTMTMAAAAKVNQLRHDVLCNRAQCNIKLNLWKSAVDDATSCISLRSEESRRPSAKALFRRAVASTQLCHYTFAMGDARHASRLWNEQERGSCSIIDALIQRLTVEIATPVPTNTFTVDGPEFWAGPRMQMISAFESLEGETDESVRAKCRLLQQLNAAGTVPDSSLFSDDDANEIKEAMSSCKSMTSFVKLHLEYAYSNQPKKMHLLKSYHNRFSVNLSVKSEDFFQELMLQTNGLKKIFSLLSSDNLGLSECAARILKDILSGDMTRRILKCVTKWGTSKFVESLFKLLGSDGDAHKFVASVTLASSLHTFKMCKCLRNAKQFSLIIGIFSHPFCAINPGRRHSSLESAILIFSHMMNTGVLSQFAHTLMEAGLVQQSFLLLKDGVVNGCLSERKRVVKGIANDIPLSEDTVALLIMVLFTISTKCDISLALKEAGAMPVLQDLQVHGIGGEDCAPRLQLLMNLIPEDTPLCEECYSIGSIFTLRNLSGKLSQFNGRSAQLTQALPTGKVEMSFQSDGATQVLTVTRNQILTEILSHSTAGIRQILPDTKGDREEALSSIAYNRQKCSNSSCENHDFPNNRFHKCARCQQVQYCGKQCQLEDWKQRHQKNCKLLQACK